MQALIRVSLLWFVLVPGVALAGTPAVSAPPQAAIIPPTVDPWEVTITPYGWLAGMSGTSGVNGYNAAVDVPFEDILNNLDMTAMLNLEARKGRWGGWVDGLYLKMSAGAETPGPLLESVGVSVDAVVAEIALFYRLWQGERGFLDLYGGARYMRLEGELSFDVSDSGIEDLSHRLSSAVVDQVVNEVNQVAGAAAASARSSVTSRITSRVAEGLANAALRVEETRAKVSTAKNQAAAKKTAIATNVAAKGAAARESLAHLQDIAAAHPKLDDLIRSSARLQAAIKSAVVAGIEQRSQEAELEARVATARQAVETAQQEVDTARQVAAAARAGLEAARVALGNAEAALDAARSSAKSRARKAVEKAEKKLAAAIEDALRDAIPEQITQSADWVDPFIGLRARYNFTDRLYAVAKADIGGFGISSDLVWQAYGALGCHLTKSKRTSIEVGYKYMSVDYTRGGFIYDMAMSGALVSIGFQF